MLSESLSGVTDPAMRVQQLLWLNNKMRLSLRNLHALQHEKNMLKHKVNYRGEVEGPGRGVSRPTPGGGCVSQHALRHPPPVDGYCRGRYPSYWNAFLFYVYLLRKRISDFTWYALKLGNLQSSNILGARGWEERCVIYLPVFSDNLME